MCSAYPQKLLNFSYITKQLEQVDHKNINPQNRLSSPNHKKLDPQKLPTIWYQIEAKYVKIINLLKQLVRTRTNIPLQPSELMQQYAICKISVDCTKNCQMITFVYEAIIIFSSLLRSQLVTNNITLINSLGHKLISVLVLTRCFRFIILMCLVSVIVLPVILMILLYLAALIYSPKLFLIGMLFNVLCFYDTLYCINMYFHMVSFNCWEFL